MGKTNIGWCDYSLNYYSWDCTRVSPGCKNCYMLAMANRYGKPVVGRPQWRGANAFKELWKIPAGSLVFVNDMSDTYHENAKVEWIHTIHNTAAYLRPDVWFLLLTKRPERAYGMRDQLIWPDNLWLGTSVENEDYLWRLDYLLETPAAGHFLSAEPLLGPLTDLSAYLNPKILRAGRRLDWIILGGESGPGRRQFFHAWALEVQWMCDEFGIPFFFKQGGAFKPGQDRVLNGRTFSEFPSVFGREQVASATDEMPQMQLTLGLQSDYEIQLEQEQTTLDAYLETTSCPDCAWDRAVCKACAGRLRMLESE